MPTTELICLRCKTPLDPGAEACPSCSEKVTPFQRTYSTRLIDGKYQIVDRLGVGGMGEIFKVRHIHLGEQRVIKIMRANIAADEQALQRFLYEAKLATTVKHRSLAMLYDFSTLDDGSYYMVWEFIDGVNIQKWITKNGPVPARLAIEIAIQALGGLGALHEMGIIHRDISPENIMLSQDHQGRLLVKVIDFGIAKQLSEGEGGQGLTQTGMFLGKLKYASPEQAGFIKEGEQLDARSDLYSFGIVLYEMLAGRTPFLATNPQGYILKHATEKPLPFARINPGVSVPASLERIVLRALEKDRGDRHRDADAFIADLASIRASVAPESRFGLGERMITLSASPTVTEGRPSATSSTRPAPTLVDRADEATVVESGASPTVAERSSSAAPTLVESIGGAAPTMVEGLGRAGPTAVQAKWDSSAAPTVLERKVAPAKRPAVRVGLAAAAVLVVALAAVMITREKGAGPIDPSTSIAGMTGTASTSTSTAPPGLTATGVLLLTGSPWAQLEKLEHLESDSAIPLGEQDRHVPLRVADLAPGTYRVTLTDADGKPVTREVRVEPSQVATLRPDVPPGIDLDRVVEDILRQ
ncbi:MAG TPA: serine/threonine-protein kinase [Thermoanaerobaculia bacterium]|nr:serine/threonine-protein kinase [Thermoanaerobaculia bacterium]